ncbi:MAG: hypothetical protein LBQ12_10655 [Deltaproteobacteria bacterium]|jgi:hypothetical protein|nr:hypothetical protein [Deltaproteobacteria bacterium]
MDAPSATDGPARKPGEIIDRALTAACLAVTAAVYFLYLADSGLLMTAEQASDLLAGMEMLRQKTLFMSDWFYADELFTLKSPLFMAFSGIFLGGSPVWTLRVSAVMELALEIAALAYMLRRLGLRGRPGLLAAALFFGARSYQSGLLCGMGFSRDASFYTALFLTFGYLAAARTGVRRPAERILRFALPAAAFLFGLSSAVMLAILYLPLLAQRLWRLMADCGAAGGGGGAEGGNVPRKGELLGEIALWNALFAAGYAALLSWASGRGLGPVPLTSGESAGFFYAVAANLPHLLGQFADSTSLAAARGSLAFASLGWYAALSFFGLCAVTLWKAPWAAGKAAGPTGEALKSLMWCLASAALLMCVHLESDRSDIRYLLYMYPFAAILLSSLYARLAEDGRPGSARLLLRFMAFAVLVTGASNIALLPRLAGENPSRAVSAHSRAIMGFLLENNVTRAYALYWDSYTLEALTSGTISVGAVDGRMMPYLKNASVKKYTEDASDGRVAFVFSRKPRPWSDPALEFQDGPPALLKEAKGYLELNDPQNPLTVYVFDGNPFTFDAAAARGPDPPPREGGEAQRDGGSPPGDAGDFSGDRGGSPAADSDGTAGPAEGPGGPPSQGSEITGSEGEAGSVPAGGDGPPAPGPGGGSAAPAPPDGAAGDAGGALVPPEPEGAGGHASAPEPGGNPETSGGARSAQGAGSWLGN